MLDDWRASPFYALNLGEASQLRFRLDDPELGANLRLLEELVAAGRTTTVKVET